MKRNGKQSIGGFSLAGHPRNVRWQETNFALSAWLEKRGLTNESMRPSEAALERCRKLRRGPSEPAYVRPEHRNQPKTNKTTTK